MERSCWICMETGTSKERTWRKICACNLYAHEACLLIWAQNTEDPKCPQCQTRLRVVRPPSKLILAREALEDAVGKTAWGTIFFYTGTIAASAVYVLLYGLGANAIQYMCSAEQVASIFGPTGLAAESGLPENLSIGEFARRAFLIPSVPVALAASEFNSPISNTFLLLLPSLLTTKIPYMHGYQRSLYIVTLLRQVHQLFRQRYVQPILWSCAEAILDSPRVDGDNRQIQEAQLARLDARNNGQEANAAVQEIERLIMQALNRGPEPLPPRPQPRELPRFDLPDLPGINFGRDDPPRDDPVRDDPPRVDPPRADPQIVIPLMDPPIVGPGPLDDAVLDRELVRILNQVGFRVPANRRFPRDAEPENGRFPQDIEEGIQRRGIVENEFLNREANNRNERDGVRVEVVGEEDGEEDGEADGEGDGQRDEGEDEADEGDAAEAAEPAPIEVLLNVGANQNQEDEENAVEPAQQIPPWLLGERSYITRMVLPQLLPVASYFLGTILRKLPVFSSMGVFNVNLVAGCLIVLGRDVVDILTARARVSQFRGMRVLEYQEPEEVKWSFSQWLRFW